ncbi:hypothetical protein [Sphingomonas psychrotolerans]|uniref:DUF2946 domain-containing protein n=1 Tax=Sphingomonas psychrotolerans TaxID=1327635 RepID=A0A2K8MDN9_9SPHN|nr:hypothetical protein [Sphingomonas psychrotolerans]ATY31957.1 hypothetical protein CVN68_08215 [Sphingomonas psychrotolerans]
MLRTAWLLLLCLIASSLMTTTTAHAQESYSAAEFSCGGAAHAEGDADEVPADGDRSVPHHHGTCHGHNLTATSASASLSPMTIVREAPDASGASRLARRTIDPALEPPRS